MDSIEGGSLECVLRKEWEGWQSGASTGATECIQLEDSSAVNGGQVALKFSLGSNYHFTLCCPAGYPQHKDSFYVEADPEVSSWCAALNEYLLEADTTLTIDKVLNKAYSLYSVESRLWQEDEDDDIEEEEGEEDEEEEEEEVEEGEEDEVEQEAEQQSLLAKKRRWQQKEAAVRTQLKQPKLADMFPLEMQPQLAPMFSCSAASGILTNDLVDLLASQGRTGIRVEPLDDNIFVWVVKLSQFEEHSPLWSDLEELQSRFGSGEVELRLEFALDLYPCFPPLVRVVRPFFFGDVALKVSSVECLRPTHWHPACSLKVALEDIKALLQEHARIDLCCPRNNPTAYPQGAYLPLQYQLHKLAWVSELPIEWPKAPDLGAKNVNVRGVEEVQAGDGGESHKQRVTAVQLKSSTVETSLVADAETGAWVTLDLDGATDEGKDSVTYPSSASSSGRRVLMECATRLQDLLRDASTGTGISGVGGGSAGVSSGLGLGTLLARIRTAGGRAKAALSSAVEGQVAPVTPPLTNGGWANRLQVAVQKEKDRLIEECLQQVVEELQAVNSILSRTALGGGRQGGSTMTALDSSFPSGLDSGLSGGALSNSNATSTATLLSSDSDVVAGTSGSSASASIAESLSHQPVPRSHTVSPQCVAEEEKDSSLQEEIRDALEASVLVSFLQTKLIQVSFARMCAEHKIYHLILDIVEEMAQQPQLMQLLWRPSVIQQVQPLHALLLALDQQANQHSSSTNGSVPKPTDHHSTIDLSTSSSSSSTVSSSTAFPAATSPTENSHSNNNSHCKNFKSQEAKLARRVHNICEELSEAIQHLGLRENNCWESSGSQ